LNYIDLTDMLDVYTYTQLVCISTMIVPSCSRDIDSVLLL